MKAVLLQRRTAMTAPEPTPAQERLFSTVGEVRTALAFKVPEDTIREMLPAGWVVSPLTIASSVDANLRLVFTDQVVVQRADGTPSHPQRFVPLVIPARKGTGIACPVAAGVFAASPYFDAYGLGDRLFL